MRKASFFFVLLLISLFAYSQQASIQPAGPTGFCPNGSVQLTIDGAPSGSTFQWLQNNSPIQGATALTYSASVAATYTAVLTANAKSDTLNSVVVSAFTAPVADFSFDNNGTCSGTVIKFTSTASSGKTPYTYEWDFGDNATSSAANPTHQFYSFGCGTFTFSVKLKVTDANGCSHTVTKQVTVKQVPPIDMQDLNNPFSQFNNCSLSPSTGNPNFTVQLGFNTAGPACATTYSVNWGDNSSQTNLTAASFPLTHTYTQLGIFDLVVTVTGTDGCQYSKTYKVVNQSNPAVGISAPGSTTGCAPAGFWFKLKGYEPNSPGTIYTWDFGDGSPQTVWTTPPTVDSIFHVYNATSCVQVNGQFVVKVTATNGCKSTTATVDNITIYGKPQAGFTSPPGACVNKSISFTNVTVGGYNQGTCDRTTLYKWNFGDPASPQNTSTLINPSHVYSATGTYTVTLIAQGSCGSDTIKKTVCVVAQPTASFTLDTTEGCTPLMVKATNTSSTLSECTDASYQWQVAYAPASCSSGAGWSFSNSTSTSVNPTFNFTNPGKYTITLLVTNACATVSFSREVLIKAPPKVNLAAIPNTCGTITLKPVATVANCGTGNLRYSWVIDNGTPITSPDPGALTFTTVGQHKISLTVTNECGSATDTRTFFVNPLPELSLPEDQVLCPRQTAGPFTFSSTTAGVTFSWIHDNPSIGLITSGTSNSIPGFTATNNTGDPITSIVTVTATSGGCPITKSFTITVNPSPAKPTAVRLLNYCLNDATSPLNATASSGNTLNWYTTFPLSNPANTAPVPSTAVAGTTTYFVTQSNNYSCESDTARIIVAVSPRIDNNRIATDQIICVGGSVQTLSQAGSISGGSGTYLYQWQQSTDEGASWTNISAATSASYNPGAITTDTRFRRLVLSSGCSDTSNVVSIVVLGGLTNNTISAAQTICTGTRPEPLKGEIPAGGNGTFTYQWQSSADGTFWNNITGATEADYHPALLTNTTYFRRSVISGQCQVYSAAVMITVNPKPVMTPVAEKILCSSSPSPALLFSSSPTAVYVWTNDNPAIGLAASGTGNLPAFTATNNSNPKVPVTATISVIPTLTNNGVSCAGDATAFSLVVLPTIALAPIPDTAVCNGQTITAYRPVPDTGSTNGVTVDYRWTVTGSGISLQSGNGAFVPAYTTTNLGTTDLVATITVTPRYTYKGISCDGVSSTYKVTVKPSTPAANAGTDQLLCAQSTATLSATFVNGTTGVWSQLGTTAILTDPASTITTATGLIPGTVYKFVWTQTGFASCPATSDTVIIDNKLPLVNSINTTPLTICAGVQINLEGLPATGGSGTYNYQWQQSTDGINFTDIPGATLQNITLVPTTTVWLRRFVSATPCSNYSDTVKVNVQPALTNNSISQNATICIGLTAPVINGTLPGGGDNNFSYVWEQSIDGGNTWTVISGATDVHYAPGALTATTLFRRLVSTSLCSGVFGSVSNVVTIIVNPDARALFLPTDTVQCSPFSITPAVINLQTSPANSQYRWYADGVLIGEGTTFPGYTLSRENDSVTISLKVISAFGCKDDSLAQQFKTPKQPSPSFTLSDTVGCGPLTITATNTSTYINEFAHVWDFGNGLTYSMAQPPPVTFAPNPASGDTTYIVRLKVFSSCDTSVFIRTVRVKSPPKALFTPAKTVGCSPMKVTFRNNSLGNNNTYFWDFGDGTTFSSTNRDTVQHTFITGRVDTFYVKLRVVNECGEDSARYAIVVSPNTVKFNVAVNGTEHFGCAPHAVRFINNSAGAGTFQWNFGDGNILSTTKNIDTVYHTYQSPGRYAVQIRAFNNCSDTTATEVIVVYPKPKAAFSIDKNTVCIGDSLRFTNLSDSATSYLWNFGDGRTTAVVNPLHRYTTPGLYTVRLIIYRNNPAGNVCSDSVEQQVQVSATLPGLFTAKDTVGQCAPFTATFVNQNKPSVTALWTFGDGTTGTGDSVVHTYTAFGTYPVQLTVTVPGGCTYTSRRTVTVLGPGGSLKYTGGYACPKDAVQLQAVASHTDSYVWDFGDGTTTTTTGQTVYHQYQNPGLYIPSVKLQNNAGCVVPLKGVDTIKVDRILAGFRTTQQVSCGSTAVSFTDTSHVFFGKASVKWVFGDGTTGNGLTISHNYTVSGSYPVEMIVFSRSGCSDTVQKQVTVKVNSRPVATINAITVGCTRKPVTFTGGISSADAVTLTQWKMSNGATGSGPSFTYTFMQPGTYTVQLIAGTNNGCYDTTTQTIQINPSPELTVSNGGNLCIGNSMPLQASGAATYQWMPLTGLSCYTCPSPVASPTVTTPYVVEGKNSVGCASYDTVVVTVIQPLKMKVSANDSICIGQSSNLLVSGGTGYSWSPATGLSSTTISNPVATPQRTTTYRVVGYDGFNCFNDTAFITVAVGQYPTVNLGPDLTLAAGTQHPLSSTITNGPIRNWAWTPSTDLSCSNCAQPVANIKKDISYAVKVTTPFGCSAQDTVNIKVFCESSQVFVPNAFTPDGDGVNDVLMVRSKGVLTVKFFRIFNRWGELIFEKSNFPPNDPSYAWDGRIRGVIGGPDVFVYTCEVMCENGTSFTYKGNVSIIK